jgi:ParB family chromosome partitioning protein
MTEPDITINPKIHSDSVIQMPTTRVLPPLPSQILAPGGRDSSIHKPVPPPPRPRCDGSGRVIAEIEPARIVESRWASTTAREWHSTEFALLKEDIQATGGNVQAIKVRPVGSNTGSERLSPDAEVPAMFEIVFGHLRHRACLELDLPILSVIESIHDAQSVKEFIVENRRRLPWQAWRLGETCRRALDAGLFHSVRRMAEDMSFDVAEACLLLELARLPFFIRDKFEGMEITRSLAKDLATAYALDPERLSRNAKQADFAPCRTARAVQRQLTGATE